ncbi:ribosome maturation factor RimM [Pseudoramibacter porci]|nr:ribosome maturation factor RimM [Pseudoramibacter porci]
MERLLTVGKITRAHGICGEMRVMPMVDDAEQFFSFKTVYIQDKDKKLHKKNVQNVRLHKKMVLLILEGIKSRNDAEALINSEILIDRSQDQLEHDEVYIADLIGIQVFDKNNNKIGKIADVLTNTGAIDTLEIQLENGKNIYVPFRKCYFYQWDLDQGTMAADIPEDFFDL